MAVIELKSIRKSFGALDIIRGLDLRIEDGEFVVFVGPSGSGKSTLLRLVAGLEEVTSGQILIGGEDVTDLGPADRALSMVFQSYALYPHKTVRGNMAFGLEVARTPRAEINRRVQAAAASLRLENYLDRKPKELSGGQRQRVAIGRAIVRDPVAFLFDEPLSNLDAALRAEMRIEIARLHQRLGATMIYVTHDQVEAMTLADKIVVLKDGEIQQIGSPIELYEKPANLFVAQFLGSPKMNVYDVEQTSGGLKIAGGGVLALPSTPLSAAKLGARPEHIAVQEPGLGHLEGRIDVVERLGSDTYAYVVHDGGQLTTVRLPGNVHLSVGQPVSLAVDREQLHLFDRDAKSIA
ncbi:MULTISPECIES: sn-glycerol-3-phosphate ABC transporter ATP-binding protein UgpC [unclassified Rhizobium]|jgi:multiple sugar transport system ATP-binding protein|uniref:ABC transporter ATP-binding protein n=1 Tax=unclassified Rhizobium TaxID=2613769 RepID=UPI000647B1DE|nr:MULTISPECIES: sn-glycerol-3-phosphate ABC transporter ATP-binding protein UgpC [unclassified Rhizobium]MBN8950584.1 sn-glycerol-3-phosphate ABC transporter ATP-binding protein UgpC [Rhizobium tropici]OJY66136.1 MAG: ABC transporter ATP-binding protein [Rhizobium sp. 60-20]RKD69318.1 multiple sugar transport system ATP-binding protein [Rhizobium sp. WW_1]